MQTNHTSAPSLLHRLLFRALLEMRSQGHEHSNKSVFHLADLFHSVVLEMQNAAEGKTSYADAFKLLEARAKEKGLEKWLEVNLDALDALDRSRS